MEERVSGFGEVVFGVVMSLVAALISVVVFFLRSMREHQLHHHAEAQRRVDLVEQEVRRLARALRDVERTHATKEEWVRESLAARRRMESVCGQVAALRATLDALQREDRTCVGRRAESERRRS